jgi:hypothetical protein
MAIINLQYPRDVYIPTSPEILSALFTVDVAARLGL